MLPTVCVIDSNSSASSFSRACIEASSSSAELANSGMMELISCFETGAPEAAP